MLLDGDLVVWDRRRIIRHLVDAYAGGDLGIAVEEVPSLGRRRPEALRVLSGPRGSPPGRARRRWPLGRDTGGQVAITDGRPQSSVSTEARTA